MPMFDKTGPYSITLAAGDAAYICQCGHTNNAPYCDGSHMNYPGKQPYEYEATEDTTIWVCGCGRSGNKPFCDGSHSK